MKIEKTKLEGVIIIEPAAYADDRGIFMEAFEEKAYQEILGVRFVQDNFSVSKKNVLRGLHYQAPPFGQGKLLQILQGSILDVAVDIRHGSPTFGEHVMVELSGDNHKQLYIPEGFAHGFLALEDNTIMMYKCTNVYSKEHDRGILWSDPGIGIAWGIENPLLSEKDRKHSLLEETVKEYIFQSH